MCSLNIIKGNPDARDAPTDNTRGIMLTTIQLKLSRSRGGGGTVEDKDEDKDVEKDVDKNKYFMKDNLV